MIKALLRKIRSSNKVKKLDPLTALDDLAINARVCECVSSLATGRAVSANRCEWVNLY